MQYLRQLRALFFITFIVLLFSSNNSFAAGTTTIVRGDPTTINWSTAGGVGQCNGTFVVATPQYPATTTVANDIRGFWVSTHNGNGSQPFPYVEGNLSASFTPYQSYFFQCEEISSGSIDITELRILDCPPLTSWTGTSCTAGPPPTGTMSLLSGTSCTIATGSSTCSTTLSWSTTNSSNTRIVNTTTGVQTAVSPSGNQSFNIITYGNNAIQLYEGGGQIPSSPTVNITGDCASGTSWNGTACLPPTGNINTASTTCTLVALASSCSAVCDWSITNALSPNITNLTTGVTYSTNASGAQLCSIPGATSTVAIRDGSSVITSATFTGICPSGTFWNGTRCAYTLPTVSGSFTPASLNAGTNYTLNWTTTDTTSLTVSCTGNAKTSIEAQVLTPIAGNTKTGAANNPMIGVTTCTLNATGPGGTVSSAPFTLTVNAVCPPTAPWNGTACVNPTVVVNLSAPSTTGTVGTPIMFTASSSDVGFDITEASINWMAPGQPLWNWQNADLGATVTPNGGHNIFAATDKHTDIFSFTPTMPGDYTIYAAARDGSAAVWGTSPGVFTLKVACKAGYINVGGVCINSIPVVSISPAGTINMSLGDSLSLTSVATDASSDITAHNLSWVKPDGVYNWATPLDAGGTVTYTNPDTMAPTGNSSQGATFTPDRAGFYKVYFAAFDNDPDAPRWTNSPFLIVGVASGTGVGFKPDPTDKNRLRWECLNANRATLVTAPTDSAVDFVNKPLPPNFGSFLLDSGSTYTVTCTNTITGDTGSASYSTPTLSSSNVTMTSLDLNFNCNNPNAKSVLLERTPGTPAIYNLTTGPIPQIGLTSNTTYSYTLRCFDGLLATGAQTGAATHVVKTISAAPTLFTIKAYIHAVSSDTTPTSSVEPISADTPDGQFYEWKYELDSPAAVCTMEQRNDGGVWYGGYASDPSTYTLSWNSLTALDKTTFAHSFGTSHDWRLTCSDNLGRTTTRMWSLKKSAAFPTVIDASIVTNCSAGPITASMNVQCANSDYYEVIDLASDMVVPGGSASASSGVVPLPGEGTYKVICKQGGSSGIANTGRYLRTFTNSMCTTGITSFTATPKTIRAGGISTLQWAISIPTASTCTLQASTTASTACRADPTGCLAARQSKVDTLNLELNGGNTDANDPSNGGVTRSVIDSLTKDALGTPGRGAGKKSLNIYNTTDFILECGATSNKVRVQVTNDSEA